MEDADDTNDTPDTARALTLTNGSVTVNANACAEAGSSSSSGGAASSAAPASSAGNASSGPDASSNGSPSSAGTASSAAGASSTDSPSSGGTGSSGPVVRTMCEPFPFEGTGAGDDREVGSGDDWYRLTIPASAEATVSLAIGTASDLDLFVYAAPGGGLIGDSISSTPAEEVTVPARPLAQDIWVRVKVYASFSSNPGSAYTLTISTTPADTTANDLCGGAMALQSGLQVSGSTDERFNDHQFGATECTGYSTGGPDLFYKISVPNGQKLTVVITSEADLAVYLLDACAGSCCWAGADTEGGGSSGTPTTETVEQLNNTGATKEYIVVVDSYTDSQFGPFALTATVAAP